MRIAKQAPLLIVTGFLVCAPIGDAQDGGISDLPLPELSFQQEEEEEPASEYLVGKPVGYLRFPEWQDSQKTAIDLGQPLHLGGGLWPGQESLIPQIRKTFRPKPIESSGFRRPDDPRLALPNVERVSPEAIPDAYLPYYFDNPPKRFLTDIQRLLTDSEWQDTDWFLTYHSNECNYKANVLLFSPEEQIPESISGKELADSWFPEQDNVLVFYFHGRPERSQVFFPNRLMERFPESEFQQNLMEAIDSASKAEAPGKQLDEFCQKLGTWLIWWEKRVKMLSPTESKEPTSESPLVGKAPEEVIVASDTGNDANSNTGIGSIVWGVIGLMALVLLGLIIWAISAALRGKRPVLFPHHGATSRLGAPHSGGGSVVLTFGSRR